MRSQLKLIADLIDPNLPSGAQTADQIESVKDHCKIIGGCALSPDQAPELFHC